MKIETVPENIVWFDGFPYNNSFRYDSGLLRSLLFVPENPDSPVPIVYDFDGISEWFETWARNDELYHDSTVMEYISENIGRTIYPVLEVV